MQARSLDPRALLDDAPQDELALLELRLDWPPELEIHPKRLQLWLRFFVMTGDPLGWIAGRGEAWAATTITGDVLELDVYVTLAALRRELERNDGELAGAVGHWAGPAMQAGLRYELVIAAGDYHDRAIAGDLPSLLADAGGDPGEFGTPEILARQEWGPVGLGALQDLVQEAFGSVDLDRSMVRLEAVEPSYADCAACEGREFAFPSGLEDASEKFCGAHRSAAREVSEARLEAARQSNPAGWRAIDKAAMRINKLPEPAHAPQPPRAAARTPARNEPCPCGSGRKYKRCHGA
ncbi:MAG: SEC-C metal-binding domain-containing protein [Solirubrobacteraceae bacterium]